MFYNLKVTFYGDEIQISRYGYTIYKREGGIENNEVDINCNKQSFWLDSSGFKNNKQLDVDSEKFNKIRSLRRSKQSIYEIVRSNTWDYFATFTFNSDRYNYDSCKNRLRNFLNNFKKRKISFEYIVVPEMHLDGAWHFHALIQGNLDGYLSSTWHVNKYELIGYKLGKCELEKVNDTYRISCYITKYITKEVDNFLKNKRRFFCSKGLNRPFSQEMFIDNQSTIDFILSNFPDFYMTYSRTCEFNDKRIDYIQLRKLEESEKKA